MDGHTTVQPLTCLLRLTSSISILCLQTIATRASKWQLFYKIKTKCVPCMQTKPSSAVREDVIAIVLLNLPPASESQPIRFSIILSHYPSVLKTTCMGVVLLLCFLSYYQLPAYQGTRQLPWDGSCNDAYNGQSWSILIKLPTTSLNDRGRPPRPLYAGRAPVTRGYGVSNTRHRSALVATQGIGFGTY